VEGDLALASSIGIKGRAGGGGGEDEDEDEDEGDGWMDPERAQWLATWLALGCLASTKSRRISLSFFPPLSLSLPSGPAHRNPILPRAPLPLFLFLLLGYCFFLVLLGQNNLRLMISACYHTWKLHTRP